MKTKKSFFNINTFSFIAVWSFILSILTMSIAHAEDFSYEATILKTTITEVSLASNGDSCTVAISYTHPNAQFLSQGFFNPDDSYQFIVANGNLCKSLRVGSLLSGILVQDSEGSVPYLIESF